MWMTLCNMLCGYLSSPKVFMLCNIPKKTYSQSGQSLDVVFKAEFEMPELFFFFWTDKCGAVLKSQGNPSWLSPAPGFSRMIPEA